MIYCPRPSRPAAPRRLVRPQYLRHGCAMRGLRPSAKIKVWTLAARYHHTLAPKMTAMWSVAIARANIDVSISMYFGKR